MLSKNQIKLVNSLSYKKFRDENKLFVAEGEKLVNDLMPYFDCVLKVSDKDDLRKVSQLSTPSSLLAVFRQRTPLDPKSLLSPHNISSSPSSVNPIILALDSVQDPGNLGTIIRTADWFGVKNILCSNQTADVYNLKVVQSTMGALARVNVIYCELPQILSDFKDNGWNIYGTFLEGSSIYSAELHKSQSIIVMGNEGNGISEKIKQLTTGKLLIPSYPGDIPTSESLNVAIATAIILSEFRR